MKNPTLRTSTGISEALCNLWYENRCSIVEIEDVVEDSMSGIELMNGLNKLNLFDKFTLDRETDKKVRLKCVDAFGNSHYFEATKE